MIEIGVLAVIANAVPPPIVIDELPNIIACPATVTVELALNVAITVPAPVFVVTVRIVPKYVYTDPTV